jgi:hypothetical protein
LKTAGEFHLTRLEWTYGLTTDFVKKAKAMGLTVGSALEDESPDANGLRTIGRVTGENGELKKHKWFNEGRWVGCANAPEFMEATFLRAKQAIDAGADIMQQDDPQMALHCVPPFCYCNYCKEEFAKYQAEHGTNASYEAFQTNSVLAFHKRLHDRIDAYAGHHIPFSCNGGITRERTLGWVAEDFDFFLSEIYGNNVTPAMLYEDTKIAKGISLSFQYRETTVPNNRRGIATFYAVGATVLMPWDVYISNTERYFGQPKDYADLSGFVRANAKYLDGYEDAAVAGPKMRETRYGNSMPVTVQGGSGEVFAFTRAMAGASNAPVVVHLVEWNGNAEPFTVRLHTENFFGGRPLNVHLRTPPAYDATVHQEAQTTGNFDRLSTDVSLNTKPDGEYTLVQVPALQPWGILVVQP